MLPIHTILHPTDFSEHSEYAFRFACALARDYGARLVVLHVAPSAVVAFGDGIVAFPIDDHQEELARLSKIQDREPKLVADIQVAEGDAVPEILRVARESACDLIVMGTHGWTGLRRLLMGSVAEGVVRRATCPVLTVKTPFPIAEPAREMAMAGAAKD